MPDELKTRSRIHAGKLGVLGMGMLALACHRSEVVRAQDERLKFQKELATAWSLVPYRSFKLLARFQQASSYPEASALTGWLGAHLAPPVPEGLVQRRWKWQDTESSVPDTGKGR